MTSIRGIRAKAAALTLLATAASVALSPVLGHASASATQADAARLRLQLTTTSDWTAVSLTGGKIVGEHVASSSGSASYVEQPSGFALNGASGTVTYVVDLVFYAADLPASFPIVITKGYVGSTSVKVTNLNGPTATVVGTYVDAVHKASDPQNLLKTVVAGPQLMTTTPLSFPRADSRHLVLAFYYPWFLNYDETTLADRPSNPRSVWDDAGVLSMTSQARSNGVDGFVVSYAGDNADGPAFDAARRAAETTGQVLTGYIETPRATSQYSAGNADPNVVRDWLVQLLRRQDSPAFLHAADGVPVVFIYGMARLAPRHWQAILSNLETIYRKPVHLVGDTTDPAYTPYEWGVHRYAVNDSAAALTSWNRTTEITARAPALTGDAASPQVVVGTVAPGYDDTKLRGSRNPVVDRAGGARYDATWQAAEAGHPDWVVVTSWNEWFEGTSIEPGATNGDLALQQTASESAAFKSN